jgi:hypothetical protein
MKAAADLEGDLNCDHRVESGAPAPLPQPGKGLWLMRPGTDLAS